MVKLGKKTKSFGAGKTVPIISFLLTLAIILPLFGPVGVFAQSQNLIIYTYKEGIGNEDQLESVFMQLNMVIDTVGDHDVTIITDRGRPEVVGRVTVGEQEIGKNISRGIWINNPSSNMRITYIRIGNFFLELIPVGKINKISSYDINVGDSISFTGEGLDRGDIKISGESSYLGSQDRTGVSFSQEMTGTTGYKNISLEMEDSRTNTKQSAVYSNAFKLLGDLDYLGEGLEVIPRMGSRDSIAYIRAEDGQFSVMDGEVLHSVFFLEDATDRYSADNMAEVISYSSDRNVIKIKVPNSIADTSYYDLVVTNKIDNPNRNIYEQILETKKVEGKFFVTGAGKGPVLTRISPEKGPETGETVQIIGRNFDELDFIEGLENLEDLKIEEEDIEVARIILDDDLADILGTELSSVDKAPDHVLKIPYKNIGGASYQDSAIEGINRYIATYIGDRTKPVVRDGKPVYRFSDQFDNLSVEVTGSNVDKETEVNVVMVMQTNITTNYGSHTILNIITNDQVKYTIVPSYTRPDIHRISPEKIQVIKDMSSGNYGLKEEMVIGIEGANFKVIRSRDPETNRDVTNYPIVGLGANLDSDEEGIVLRLNPENEGQVEISRGGEWITVPGADMLVLDGEGNVVDGTIGRDTGSKINIRLPRAEDIIRLAIESVTTDMKDPKPKAVYIMNPILGSREAGDPISNDNVSIMFVDIGDNLSPAIERISPNVVAIDSGEEIRVTGSNFQSGIRVFIGGVEVTGVREDLDPSGVNTILRFNAPSFPQIIEGPTRLTVMNLDGGQDSKNFTYVKSLQRDPNLTDFTPKSGTMGTVVVVDGDNFMGPDPAVGSTSGMGIYRLLGSRILMDGKDINEYNLDRAGNIELVEYTNDIDRLIVHEGEVVNLSDYYHSIILEDKNRSKNFYAIYQDPRGNIILSDGGSGSDESSIINQYYLIDKEGKLLAEKDGQEYPLSNTPQGLTIHREGQDLELIMKTPYKYNNDTKQIYGSRVHIIDKNRIEFTVPQLNSKLPGGYTITVENPDTKKSTIKDLFYYYETVSLKPKIDAIKPSIGSIEGGYQILIQGENFEDDSKVYVDGLLVAADDIERTTIDGQDTLIITRMPAYRRDMAEEETDRKIVPLVVENGNGGTALGRFTYVIPPSAKPIVDSVEFQKERQVGSAAGDEILTITGRYFKFEEAWSLTRKYRDWREGEREGQTIYYEDLDGSGDYTLYKNWLDYKEKDGKTRQLPTPIESYEEYLDSPVLPTVRIGGIESQIVEFGTNYIKVITPQISPGRHELYVVNNDFGTSNRVNINFEGSRITIDRIVGDTGKKQGRDSVEILGSGFQNTRMRILENGQQVEAYMPKVRFATIGDIKDINNNRAQVTVENGDFTLEYDNSSVDTALVTMTGKYNKENYRKTFTIENYNGQPIYLPSWELKNSNGQAYPGYELVRLESKNRKLIVEKGYAPETELINSGQIALETPSYYSVGNVVVEVSNPDGGRATSNYRYTNPASKPRITNITRDGMDPVVGDDGRTRILRMDYRGGQNIAVLGEDFREGARIQIGSIVEIGNQDIIETLDAAPNKLAFTMPEVGDNAIGNLYRLTVINGDGAQASSDNVNNIWSAPIYIQFIKGESDPEASSVKPDRGPATGGTKVTIKGKDFREEMEGYEGEDMKIFFGDRQVAKKDIRLVDHTSLEVIAPESDNLGPVRVKIENPDGSLSQENLSFTYISKPRIDDVNPKKIFTNDTETEISIAGSQFQAGATVIVGGKTIPLKDLKADMEVGGQGITGVDPQGNNREVAVIGGMPAASVRLEDGQLKVRFNQGQDLENSSIIIINPDGGVSDPYDDFQYEKPLPLKPMVLEGIAGYESTVMLIWNESDPDLLNRASKYEVYGRLAKDTASSFIGSTEGAQYLIKGLEPNTEYIFMVRALNEYGAALDFAEVRVRTLSLQEDDKQKEKEDQLKEEEKELLDKGREEIRGSQLIKTLGREDISYGLGNLDFNLSKYKNTTEVLINIPLALARTDSTLNIEYGELQMSINPKDLYTYRVSALDKGDQDANLQIRISRSGESHIPRGKKLASRAYEFDFAFQTGRDRIAIDQLLRPGQLTLRLDNILYANARNVELYQYQPATGAYSKVSNSRTSSFGGQGKYILLSNR